MLVYFSVKPANDFDSMTDTQCFYIAEHQIDLARSVITFNAQETKVEPKILQVLLLLAKRQGEVVSHQTIMETVWEGTEVVPNALQRCIARLRKVLNDDAKSPSIIATHPKIGYRLMVEVQWSSDVAVPEENTPALTNSNRYFKILLFRTVTCAALLIVSFALWHYSNTSLPIYSKVAKLTHTIPHERHAQFSPTGQFVIFNRSTGACQSHIWAKNLTSGKEIQLTAQAGFYQDTRFTHDGRELVFIEHNQCDEKQSIDNTVHVQQCWRIATLDFAQALSQPQHQDIRVECGKMALSNPIALENHQYAFLQLIDERFQLQQYDDLSKQFKPLYQDKLGTIYHYDYHQDSQLFAVLSVNEQAQSTLSLLNRQGKLHQQVLLKLPKGTTRDQRFYGSFSTDGTRLITSSHGRLYQIGLSGEVTLIDTPTSDISAAMSHPKNNDLLIVAGQKDIDIAELNLHKAPNLPVPSELGKQQLAYESLARATSQDKQGKYQPKGELIAFISNRSGQDQIWVIKDKVATQLTDFKHHHQLSLFSWSPDGKTLALASQGKVQIVGLNSDTQEVALNINVSGVLAWQDKHHLLITSNTPKANSLYLLNLTNNTLALYPVSNVNQVWLSDTYLFYSDVTGRVFKRHHSPKSSNNTLLPSLNGKSLHLTRNEILSYSFQSKTLNKYDLNGQLIEQLMPLKKFAWKVTDRRGENLLIEQVISINHDIALLKSQ